MTAEPIPPQEPTAATQPSRSAPKLSATLRRILYLPLSLVLLLPCYWQPRIQAGDLSSHIYNAWLSGLIENGRTDGLVIVRQTTNVLFDLILNGLFRWLGPDWAQRLAVSLVVLTFIWGAFAFVSTVSGRKAWAFLPCLAMLAYGWVFHMGFFNFYLALGLCFWALSLVWQCGRIRMVAAAVIFAVAYTAHALPVIWALGLTGYLFVARLCPDRWKPRLLTACMLLLVAGHFAVRRTFVSNWSPNQFTLASGADQVWVFDGKYYFLLAALLLTWGAFFLALLRSSGARSIAVGIPMHWCVLSAAGVAILPGTVFIPGFQHSLVYISERMSLGVGVCVCAMLAAAPARRLHRYAMAAVALIFFVFLFRDERNLNGFEDRVDRVVAQLAPGQRVVSPIVGFDLRADALVHMVDRACLGRCYSYANYEPSTAQFRIRVVKQNPFVAFRYDDSWKLQNGQYVIHPEDLPLLALCVSDDGQITVRNLKAGVASGATHWQVLQNRKSPVG